MDESELLKQELEHYRSEKEDFFINIVFLLLVVLLFGFDVAREVLHLSISGFPQFFSKELAILLISIKIIWMISKQIRVEHFQFWLLNSIEFQINLMSKKIRDIEDKIYNTQEPEQ